MHYDNEQMICLKHIFFVGKMNKGQRDKIGCVNNNLH